MTPLSGRLRTTLPVLLALVVLRALVPAGYMPGSAGSGHLFVMCHDSVPAAVLEAIAGDSQRAHSAHSGHGHALHGGHDHDHSTGPCSVGHLTSQVCLDSTPAVDIAVLAPDLPSIVDPIRRVALAPRYRQTARGPPA